MSTAEMSMATNTARALIDARLEMVERALFGRISRAERMDIVGEVESRIDEFLRERCGPGNEPTREDVLAVLVRLDPPEAYLDFESGEDVRMPSFESQTRPARLSSVSDESKLRKWAFIGGISGIVALFFSVICCLLYFLGAELDSGLVVVGGCGISVLTSIAAGCAALVFAGLSRLKTGWSITALALGVISIMLTMMQLVFVLFAS